MELPLTHPEYYEEMGIKPPKGVILYGAPGTGNLHVHVRVQCTYTCTSVMLSGWFCWTQSHPVLVIVHVSIVHYRNSPFFG